MRRDSPRTVHARAAPSGARLTHTWQTKGGNGDRVDSL